MATARSSAIQIAHKGEKKLSKEQQTFNRLIKNIHKERACLQEWEAIIPLYKAKEMNNLCPLIEKHTDHIAQMVIKLDHAYKTVVFSKRDKEKLSQLIMKMAEEVICSTDREDIKQVYNAHSLSDFDGEEATYQDAVKALIEAEMGLKLDDEVDIESEEAMLKFAEFMKGKIELEEERPKRKKTAKMIEKEVVQENEALKLKQSIKEIYRKLAQELHPDREQDELERHNKHEMMQRANVAYKAKNLLDLLELQFEIEQSSQEEISETPVDRLKSYNKILQEQLYSIQLEVDSISYPFFERLPFALEKRPNPKNVIAILESKIKSLECSIEGIQNDLRSFDSPKKIKEWLKKIQPFQFG